MSLTKANDSTIAGLLDAWRDGDPAAGLVIADYFEELGNDDELPLVGLRWLAEAGKVPFEEESVGRLPDDDSWHDGIDELRPQAGRVWTWLWSDDSWGLPYDVLRGIAAPYRPWEYDEEVHYRSNDDLVRPFGDPAGVTLSRTLRIVEVATFPLAVVLAALGHEVRIGLREGAPPAAPRNTQYD